MQSKLEQTEAILSYATFDWAAMQLGPDESIDNKRFRDFLSVTEAEVLEHVLQYGFNPKVVAQSDRPFAWNGLDASEHICILSNGQDWEVFYSERGMKQDLKLFASKADAICKVVHMLYEGAKISLNHRYYNAHPAENLPLPSQMD